ncbi:hypothetical protein EES47_24860 [Streptomyces sp. ADI98-12]|nr:hypothetical protein EES47_24860 [Streptomyces sp. ADI98-12]
MDGGHGPRVVQSGEPLRSQVVQDSVVHDSGGVHHRGERGVGGDAVEDACEGVPVGGVAGDEGDARAGRLQFGAKGVGTRRARASAAEQYQVLGAGSGEPACHVGTSAAGPAGDEDGAAWLPARVGLGGRRRNEPSGEGGGRADGHLVLAVVSGEDGREAAGGALVPLGGQIDEPAPRGGVFERRDPAQAPDGGLGGGGDGLGTRHRDGSAGQAPQGGVDLGVEQGLEQGRGRDGGRAGRFGGGDGLRSVGEGQQGDHTGEGGAVRGQGSQPAGERLPLGGVHGEAYDVGAEGVEDGGGPGVLGQRGGHDGQPGPGRGGGAGGQRQRLPRLVVAVGVDHGLVAPPAPPGGEGRQHRAECVGVHGQVGGEAGQVLALHGGPEGSVERIGGAAARAGRPGVGPVADALEGVGRQFDSACAGAFGPGGPVHVDAVDVQRGERGEQGGLLGPVLAQRGHGHTCGLGAAVVQRPPGEGGEDAAGADLQEGVGAGLAEGADAVGEADGLAHVPHPVLGVGELSWLGERTGHVGDDRDARLGVRQGTGGLAEGVEHRLHEGGVEGVADRQALDLALLGREPGRERGHFVFGAGYDHGVRSVDRGQGQAPGQPWGHLGLGGPHSHHGAAGGQFPHQAGAGGDQRAGVLQREHARHVCGGDLTDGVAGDVLRRHPLRHQQAVEGDLDGEERGLGVAGGVEESCLLGAFLREQHFAQRTVPLLVEQGQDLVQRPREHREPAVQFAAHSGPLRALAREQHREPPLPGTPPRHLHRLVPGTGARHQDRPVREGRAAGGQGVTDVERRGAGDGGETAELPVERLRGLRGDRPRDGRGGQGRCAGRRGLGTLRRLLDDGVRVGTADAEGGDGGPAGAAGLGPLGGLGQQADVALGPVHVGGGPVDVK